MKFIFASLFIFLCISNAAFSFFLDDPLTEGIGIYNTSYKDINEKGPQNPPKRSKIYEANYPTVGPIVHSYNHVPILSPFSAGDLSIKAPKCLDEILSKHFASHEKTFSFIVQGIEAGDRLTEEQQKGREKLKYYTGEKGVDYMLPNYSLKPQYLLFPNCPTFDDQKARSTTVQWAVMPGAEGKIEPVSGGRLLSNTVSAHPIGSNKMGIPNNYMILSGDCMHLKGISPLESIDFYSLVGFSQKKAHITYSWLLAPKDLDAFNYILSKVKTFRQLILGLDTYPSFKKRLNELKQYVTAFSGFLYEPLSEGKGIYNMSYKDISPQNPPKRSKIYEANYPTVGPIVHSYNHVPILSPFSAGFLSIKAPKCFEEILSKQFANHEKTFSFIVQGIEAGDRLTEEQQKGRDKLKYYTKNGVNYMLPSYSLKPQYLLFPNCPTFDDQKARSTTVQWAVMPGAEGKIEPVSEGGLLSNTVSAHPIGSNKMGIPNNYMILSGDIMHLKGINPLESIDFYSLVGFCFSQKKAHITYSWLLAPEDLDIFNLVLSKVKTFYELILGLEGSPSFKKRLNELKQYTGFAKRDFIL